MKEKLIRFNLKNGVRVIHTPEPGENVHCALLINAGTRDEKGENTGLAHLIEHCIFKGTPNKTSLDILQSIDAVGGELNAYTTKEDTCVYVSVGLPYFERALELLSDITLNSVFPAREVSKEKDVISDEIHAYLDSPAEQIHDDFEAQLFHLHPLGRNILGDEKAMRGVTASALREFIHTQYRGRNVVFSCAGNIAPARVKKLTEKYLSPFLSSEGLPQRKTFGAYKPFHLHPVRKTHQAHCILGNLAYSSAHPYRTVFILLNNLLGGPAMNSRLNLGIREKYGYTYQIESNYTAYSDSGIFSIYFGTDPGNVDITGKLIRKELNLLMKNKLSTRELHDAKVQLCGQITLARESRLSTVISHAKNLLLFDEAETLGVWMEKIRKVSAAQILEAANEIFEEKRMSSLLFSPGHKRK
ncbi:MAG TPA: pitrilysin family protein [Bacteroidia bacterium]|jgi:predicted Zn-dependent peptidase|nr:pitrilysin family protein [Bacteroidia bacterium]